jgi:hypothetical protein
MCHLKVKIFIALLNALLAYPDVNTRSLSELAIDMYYCLFGRIVFGG